MLKVELCDDVAQPGTGLLKAVEVQKYIKSVSVVEATRRLKRLQLEKHRKELLKEREAAVERAYAEGIEQFATATLELRNAKETLADELEVLLKSCLESVFRKCSVQDFADEVIAPVLEKLHGKSDVSIIVPSSKMVEFEKAFAKFKGKHLSGLRVAVEPSVDPISDECIIYTGSDVLDLSIPVITDRLIKAVSWSKASTAHKRAAKKSELVK